MARGSLHQSRVPVNPKSLGLPPARHTELLFCLDLGQQLGLAPAAGGDPTRSIPALLERQNIQLPPAAPGMTGTCGPAAALGWMDTHASCPRDGPSAWLTVQHAQQWPMPPGFPERPQLSKSQTTNGDTTSLTTLPEQGTKKGK